MKKILAAVLILSMGNWLWCDLQDHYKKGELVLKGIEGFGEGNDWEELFYDPYKDMAAAPDGSIFVVNSRTHNVFKFDKNGKFLKAFGRRGNGPGEHVNPDDPSILDNKYLVVGEYAANRRFTLWDLNGNYKNVVRTKTSIFYLTALRGNRVAYYTFDQHVQKTNGYQSTVAIIIKDITSGEEKIIKKITFPDRSSVKTKMGGSFGMRNFFGEVYLVQTIDGNLAVGFSNQPQIDIFSPTGEMIHSFDLKITPIPAGKTYIKEFKDNFWAELNGKDETTMNSNTKFVHELQKKTFRNFDFSTLFAKYLPLYKEILVDSEGNFLVFTFTPCQENCNPIFQVYSKEGKFICETKLNRGKYELEIDRRFKKICFTSEGIFGLFMNRGDEDEIFRLIKSNYPPAP
jgi:hypothetical protein